MGGKLPHTASLFLYHTKPAQDCPMHAVHAHPTTPQHQNQQTAERQELPPLTEYTCHMAQLGTHALP